MWGIPLRKEQKDVAALDFAGGGDLIVEMRLAPLVLLSFLTSAVSAAPIHVLLEDEAPGGFGSLSFSYDPALQGPPPYDYADIAEYTGDYIGKQGDYRINVADYFRADMGDWTGYGYDWLLERYPPDLGIHEEYAEFRFFGPAGQQMVLYSGRTFSWKVGSPVGASLWVGGDVRSAAMRIAALGDTPPDMVPEPGSLALLGVGLATAAFFRTARAARS